MRVITGTAKGVNLNALSGTDTRPTSDKVKEAMFSAIQFDVEGAVVLDLFAGSGQLGIEALSRGAKKAYFVDNNSKAIAIIEENLNKTGLSNRQLHRVDRLPHNAFLRMVKENFDIAFLDPPYEKGFLEKTLPSVALKMNPNGIIVCEHEKKLKLQEQVVCTCDENGVKSFIVEKVYEYGFMSVTIYRGGFNG